MCAIILTLNERCMKIISVQHDIEMQRRVHIALCTRHFWGCAEAALFWDSILSNFWG